MKKMVSLLLSLSIVLSMFSTISLSAFAETNKYLVDMIGNGEATVDTPISTRRISVTAAAFRMPFA